MKTKAKTLEHLASSPSPMNNQPTKGKSQKEICFQQCFCYQLGNLISLHTIIELPPLIKTFFFLQQRMREFRSYLISTECQIF